MSLSFIACDNTTNPPTQTVYVASGHPAWPPIMSRQDDSIVGVGPELVQKIFLELGEKVNVKYTGDWDLVQSLAKSGVVDVLVAAYKNPERETYMDYSDTYTVDPVVIYVRSDRGFPFDNWSALIDKVGVVTKGDSYGAAFDQFIKDSLAVIEVASPETAFQMIQAGQADYFVYAMYSGDTYLANNDLQDVCKSLPKYVASEDFYITISKQSPLRKYLPDINRILARYKKDGTIDALIAKYKK